MERNEVGLRAEELEDEEGLVRVGCGPLGRVEISLFGGDYVVG